MEHAKPPAALVLEGGPENQAKAWRKWLKQFEDYLQVSGMYKYLNKSMKATTLLTYIGAHGYDIYCSFKMEVHDDDIDVLIQKFNEYFVTITNTVMARFKFFTRSQMEGENIDVYVTALRLLSQHCEFEHLEDSLIRDRIVCGIIDSDVSYKLHRTDGLSLEKAIKICKENEVSKDQNPYNKDKPKSQKQTGGVDGTRGTRHRGASETVLKEQAFRHHVGVQSHVPPARNAATPEQKDPQKNKKYQFGP